MRVILGEAAHARQPAQLAALLEAIDIAELRQSQRQVAVTAHLRFINHDMMRAVHRLQQIAFLLALSSSVK